MCVKEMVRGTASAEQVYAIDREHWREWLWKNHRAKKEVWLIYYKVDTGKPSVPYDDSVEEALCFGWIDGVIKKLDAEKFGRKFMPRKKNSRWSESNKNRAEKMIREGRMTEAGMTRVREAKLSGAWFRAPIERKELETPPFFKEALAKNKNASDYFSTLAPTYRRHFVSWVSSAQKEETRKKRLAEALSYLEHKKKLPLK
jgi:uncharacterized protein YdeI (YjbR/CyaY-like superfamily)